MRRTSSALLLAVLVPGLLLTPVVTSASSAAVVVPVPVAPGVVELPVAGVDAAAAAEPAVDAPAVRLLDGDRRTVLLTSRTATADYGMVGVTWDRTPAPGVVEAWARTRTDGTWSEWTLMGGAADEEPDAAEAPGTREATTPLWVGHADGVQVRVDLLSGAAPTGLRVALVDPGQSAADAEVAEPTVRLSYARTATAQPPIRSRAQWGADESIRTGSPSYAASVKAVVVHHTASTNDYAPADVPSLLRGFYAYHVKSRGWSDIGYNVLVDRFGTAWEGRAGGLSRAVIGSHAGGFNTGTFGVSMIGTFDVVAPTAAQLETVAQVTAWKTSTNGIDPHASISIRSGGSTRFAAGTVVTLPTIMGHRQVSTTSCPGVRGYAALPALRDRIAALAGGAAPVQGTLQLVAPSYAAAGSTVSLAVLGGVPGAGVELFFARRGEEGMVKRRDAVLTAGGSYRTTFTADDDYTVFAVSGGRATQRTTVRRSPALAGDPRPVPAPVRVAGPLHALAGATVHVTATGPAGSAVSIWFRPEGDDLFTKRREGVLDAGGHFATTYTAQRAQDYFARTDAAASPEATTALGPVPNELDVTGPASATAGQVVPVAVQGVPGAAVQVWFARRGADVFTRRREGVLGPDGMYRTSYVAADDQTFFATSGSRASLRRTTRTTTTTTPSVLATPRLSLAAPRTVDAGATVPVSVRGVPGAGVELWLRKRGAVAFRRASEGRIGPNGIWTTGFVASDDHEIWAASGDTTSGDLAALAVPAVGGPASAPLGAQVRLTGRARPGDVVVVESRRRGTTTFLRRSLIADAGGTFAISYAADDEYEYRPVTGTRVGALHRTTVAPTGAGPATARRGSTVALSGTARPGATVEVLFRRDDAPGWSLAARIPRALPLFRLGRSLTADAAGRWSTSFVLSTRETWYARADGTATAPRTAGVS